jgi:hypothetical protein
MRNPIDILTGKVPVTVQLDRGVYDFLKDTTTLNGQTPSKFITDITRVEVNALIGTLAPEWFDQAAIRKKYGITEARQPKT